MLQLKNHPNLMKYYKFSQYSVDLQIKAKDI